jgi:hypothetical protein
MRRPPPVFAAKNAAIRHWPLVLQRVHTFGMVRPRISPASARDQRLTLRLPLTSWPPKGTPDD